MASALALIALVAAAVAAHAGYKTAWPTAVWRSGSTGGAYGSLGTARNSSNSTEYIQCGVSAYSSPTSPPYVWCSASDAAGTYAYCSAATESQAKAVMASSGDSFVYFTFDGTGTCTYLSVTSGSQYEPKQP